jgi:putative peptide zinc metalloprotease protein
VNEMGILFILFIPLTYVNASSSWTFPSRWQRIHVALAGMYIELFVAWIAILYWATHMGTAGGLLAHNIILVAGVSSLLFNANPLMRFDGYYVLSDIVQIPNLYFHGLTSVRRRSKKFWLNIIEPGEDQPTFVKVYGIGVNLWRILVLCSLGYIAAGMFSGWGLILTIVAAAGWILQPLFAFVERIPSYKEQNPKVISHFLIRLAGVGLIGGFVLFGLSWEKNINVPGVVLFDEQHSIRTVSEGFVDHILVKEGDLVVPGQLLLELVNKETESSSRELAFELEILDLKRRLAISSGTHSELQILDQQRKVLQKRKANLDADLDGLKIYAPGTGKLVGHALESLRGTWVNKGAELAQVVSPRNKHLVASVDQDDISSFVGRMGEEVLVDMRDRGLGRFSGHIEKVAPVALLALPHPSMAAIYGGPFDVKPAPSRKQEEAFVLFSPRFSVTVQLPDEAKRELRSGQQARVQIKGTSKTPAKIIWKAFKDWFLHRQNPQA